MSYVDGFVLPVPKKKLNAYWKMAKLAGKVWKDHGALEYVECVADDVKNGKCTSFPQQRQAQARRDRGILLHRLQVARRPRPLMKKVMTDKRLAKMMDPKTMPFDGKRMFWGGFKSKVECRLSFPGAAVRANPDRLPLGVWVPARAFSASGTTLRFLSDSRCTLPPHSRRQRMANPGYPKTAACACGALTVIGHGAAGPASTPAPASTASAAPAARSPTRRSFAETAVDDRAANTGAGGAAPTPGAFTNRTSARPAAARCFTALEALPGVIGVPVGALPIPRSRSPATILLVDAPSRLARRRRRASIASSGSDQSPAAA